MLQFFKNLMSSQSDASSKRFAALFTLLNIILITWVATLAAPGYITPEFMFNSLALIAGGGLGLTVIEKIFNKTKSDDETKK
jgi:hypothetical protein